MSSARGGSARGGSARGGGTKIAAPSIAAPPSAGARSRVSRRSKSPDMQPGEQPGLRRLVQKRLLDDVFQAASGKTPSDDVGRTG
jgi:hypothetical protein